MLLFTVVAASWVGVPVGGAHLAPWGGGLLGVVALVLNLATKSIAGVSGRGVGGGDFKTMGGAFGDATT